jgi:16S rRNA (uracil1498-N3)-methyltransferase
MSDFLCRLFVQESLGQGQVLSLDVEDFHYVKNVLRAQIGQKIRLFNGSDGEWSGVILEISKKSCLIDIGSQLFPQKAAPPIILYFAPLRQNRLDILIEKTVELGVLEFRPILTEFTQVRKLNLDRIQTQIKEASEQSLQMHRAQIFEPIRFSDLLKKTPVWICDESRTGKHILQMSPSKQIHIAIGPEGGFSPLEKEMMAQHTTLSLGNSILRAETAAICAVAFANYLSFPS